MSMFDMAKKMLGEKATKDHDTCGVKACENERKEVVELKPFDPIDHGKTIVPLCEEEHLSWARERNELAEEIHQEFREYRKEIGEYFAEEVNRLETPPGGELDDAASIDQIKQVTEIVRSAYSEDGISVDDVEEEL